MTAAVKETAKRRNLFELVNDDARIIEEEADQLVASGMSYEDAIVAAVEKADTLTADKVLAYGAKILEFEQEAALVDEIAKRHQARAKTIENTAKRLRERLLQLLPRDFKAKNSYLSVSFSPNPVKVDDKLVTDIAGLPAELRTEVPATWAINKDAAKEELIKRMEQLQARLVENSAGMTGEQLDIYRRTELEKVTQDLGGLRLVQGWRVSIK